MVSILPVGVGTADTCDAMVRKGRAGFPLHGHLLLSAVKSGPRQETVHHFTVREAYAHRLGFVAGRAKLNGFEFVVHD